MKSAMSAERWWDTYSSTSSTVSIPPLSRMRAPGVSSSITRALSPRSRDAWNSETTAATAAEFPGGGGIGMVAGVVLCGGRTGQAEERREQGYEQPGRRSHHGRGTSRRVETIQPTCAGSDDRLILGSPVGSSG